MQIKWDMKFNLSIIAYRGTILSEHERWKGAITNLGTPCMGFIVLGFTIDTKKYCVQLNHDY